MNLLDSKIDSWKNKLLDLGKRNRLLNYKDTKRSNLRIRKPEILSLWQSFVEDEKPLKFMYVEDTSLFVQGNTQNSTVIDNEIVTNQTLKDRQKTLGNLRDKAKIAMEEQGVNILYLSFGFLKWSEITTNSEFFYAPIILVPVILSLESITSPYILKLHEDEIVVNPTLAFKLSKDFGIQLPEFDQSKGLENYFNEIKAFLKDSKWSIELETSLSLLSFLKINMYHDLEIHKEKIKTNGIVKALTGDMSAIDVSYAAIHTFDHDRDTSVDDIFQVVDADSSQQDAIELAKKGTSFVLQGPPGTGKSQTITNIIAESLANKKKVLFVSEKMAALEVVKKRLTACGLSDFCLTLHSYKANKKEVLDQLSASLKLSRQKASVKEEAFEKLQQLNENRVKLNEYANIIFKVIEPFSKTFYEVFGQLAMLEECDNLIFNIDNVKETNQKIFNKYINVITDLANAIKNMSCNLNDNAWQNTNILALTNELSHNIKANFPPLLIKLKNVYEICKKLADNLFLKDKNSSYHGVDVLINVLETAKDYKNTPIEWLLYDDLTSIKSEFLTLSSTINSYKNTQFSLSKIKEELAYNDEKLILSPSKEIDSISKIKSELEKIDLYLYSIPFIEWKDNGYDRAKILFEEAYKCQKEITAECNEIQKNYQKEIFNLDYNEMLKRFLMEYKSIFKIFKSNYKQDKQTIQALHNDLKKHSDDQIKHLLNKLKNLAKMKETFSSRSELYIKYFGNLFNGENTNYELLIKTIKAYGLIHEYKCGLEAMLNCLNLIDKNEEKFKASFYNLYKKLDTNCEELSFEISYAELLKQKCNANTISNKFLQALHENNSNVQLCKESFEKLKSSKLDLDLDIDYYLTLFDTPNNLKSISLASLYNRIQKGLNNLVMLEEWIDYRQYRNACISEGLSEFVEKIEVLNINHEDILNIFKKRFYRLWLDYILPNYPYLLNFRARNHESLIDEFVSLDMLQLDIAKARIKKMLIDEIPSFDIVTSGKDELNILKRELTKQRRIMPIRRLFKHIPHLLLTLKPCLMMSPLSVSLFLEAESYKFDLVIFDEASQVCTENAIGAISRGSQVIIAGDSKQLPPTNFFNSSAVDNDFDNDIEDDELEDNYAYESILDEASLLPERTLLWHYRSRHEHLIAFSNAKIYNKSLITFPANMDRLKDNGVEFFYVEDGIYDRGGKKGNIKEAVYIANLVFEHFKNYPKRSLGVIAFGEVQQHAIDSALKYLRKNNTEFEDFFNEDMEEAFFVKNLENVQGDERDTIIFSIGYARNAEGKFLMNFGPLSRVGGERRLNVAITRAKRNIKLVSSIYPNDIDTSKLTTEGPKLLRAYMEFAANGISAIATEEIKDEFLEKNSIFEEAVYKFLIEKGYKATKRVGCSDYRIDIGIMHPTIENRYVLGIECDGSSYHNARTARERDRLRKSVLIGMGWNLYRIWSLSWTKNAKNEGEKLIEIIEKAIGDFDKEVNSIGVENNKTSFLNLAEKNISTENIKNPYGFEQYKETNLYELKQENGKVQLKECVLAIIYNEFPIHYDILCKRLSPLFGSDKITSTVRHNVDYCINALKDKIVRRDSFIYPLIYNSIIPKVYKNTRPLDNISIDEIVEALYIVASKSYGITKEELFQATAKEYGFSRLTDKVRNTLNIAYTELLKARRVTEIDGKISCR